MHDYNLIKYGLVGLITFLGFGCVLLGYRLIRTGFSPVDASSSAEIALPDGTSLKLSSITPGIAFLVAGALIMLLPIMNLSAGPSSIVDAVARDITLDDDAISQPADDTDLPSSAEPVLVQPDIAPTADGEINFFKTPFGSYRRQGNQWLEFGLGSTSAPTFTFVEAASDDDFIVLYDSSRDTYVRLPKDGGVAEWSQSNPIVWKQLFFVDPENAEGS